MFLEYALAFALGSVPTAYWYARYFHHIDIRQYGSGNIGATNSFRTLGKKAGLIVFIIDFLKGLIPVLVLKQWGYPQDVVLTAGIFAVLGHIFTPITKFKGGKGIATSFGVILGFSPWAALICIALFVSVVYFTRYVSLGSVIGVIAFAIFVLLSFHGQIKIQILALALSLLLIFSHRDNLKRLLAGKENKI